MINVWIATEPMQRISSLVLRHSLTRRASEPLDVKEMSGLSLGCENQFFTGFSIYRFHVPFLMGYAGKAVVMDTDIVNLSDIAELFNTPMTSAAMARRRDRKSFYTSVMLLDCEKLQHWKVVEWGPTLARNRVKYHKTMWGIPGGFSGNDLTDLNPAWNSLDDAPATAKQIHYTNLGRQPWRFQGHKDAGVFLRELKHAVENGVITKEIVLEEEAKGHVYVGLLKDVMAS